MNSMSSYHIKICKQRCKKLRKKKIENSLLEFIILQKERFLTKLSVSRRHKLFFKSIHFQIVGDKASGELEKLGQIKKTDKKRKRHENTYSCYNPLTSLLKMLPLIYPQSVSKIIWDLCLCIVLIYFFIMIPLELAFNNSIMYFQSIWLTVPFYLFLIIDYLMKMNTVYYEYGQPIIERSLIFNNYLKQGLLIDGISLIVLLCGFFKDYFIQSHWLNLSLILFIIQYHYFAQVVRNMEESIHLSKTQSSIVNLAKLIFTILYFLHIYSCLWYFIGSYANEIGMINWLDSRHLSEASYETQYLEAFYFSTVTMISVGYGDIVLLKQLKLLDLLDSSIIHKQFKSYGTNQQKIQNIQLGNIRIASVKRGLFFSDQYDYIQAGTELKEKNKQDLKRIFSAKQTEIKNFFTIIKKLA